MAVEKLEGYKLPGIVQNPAEISKQDV
jgi:hypothetical protein